MKKTARLSVLGLLGLLSISFAYAQKKVSPDHVNFFKDATAQTKELNIDIVDAIARMEYLKFKVKVNNTSTDYIVFKPKESSVIVDGKSYSPNDRMMLISPLKKGSRVIDIKGNGTNMHVEAYSFKMDGIAKIKVDAPVTKAPNFKLPAAVNQFTAGDFVVQMLKIKKETAVTEVKFKVTYTGTGYGMVDPSKVAVKTDKTGDTEYATTKSEDAFLLAKGESDNFVVKFEIPGKVVDMQFANMEIVWRDTFKEAEFIPLESVTLNLEFDPGLTAGKNK